MDLFDLLPLASVVSDRYFCLPGGISHKLTSLSQINEIDRKQEPQANEDNLFTDLLWSKPAEDDEFEMPFKCSD